LFVQQRVLITLFFAGFFFGLQAQPTLDTINMCLRQKPQLFAKLDGKNSFVENSRAKIFGAKLGISYGKRVHFGIGYNQLYPPSDGLDQVLYFRNDHSELFPVIARLHMYYVSAYAEYTFYTTKHWQLSMPLQFGIGKSYYTYRLYGNKFRIDESFNFIYEPAISVEYKIVKWFGLGADVGYRFMVANDKHLNKNFTSPTYAFKFLIYYGEIYKSLFPRSKLGKKL
jgi:hypothetical protein